MVPPRRGLRCIREYMALNTLYMVLRIVMCGLFFTHSLPGRYCAIEDLFPAFQCVKMLELLARSGQPLSYRSLLQLKHPGDLGDRELADHREQETDSQVLAQACHGSPHGVPFTSQRL